MRPGTKLFRVSTPGERRRRAQTLRKVGWGFIVAGLVAACAGIFVTALELDIVGGAGALFTNCGTMLDPFAGAGCSAALAPYVVFAWAAGAVALVCVAVGIVVLWRVPRR